MNSRTLERFWRLYESLPQDVRRQARRAYRRFRRNPHHPGLHFHRLAGHPDYWSVRVSRDYRAVGILEHDTITWIWIGSHADFDGMFSN